MDHFHYINHTLHAEEVAISDIIAAVGTPFYCYSTATLIRHYHVFADPFIKAGVPVHICYSIKANSNQAVLATLAKEGSGGDAVSGGEIRRALKAGMQAKHIVFSGVGKTKDELAYALSQGILMFNVESLPELYLLNQVAEELGQKASVSLRINPDVDAKTHKKITTGKKENKFGIAWEQAEQAYQTAASLPAIHVMGVTTHIGSQLLDLTPFNEAFHRIKDLVQRLRAQGHVITHLDLGGGLGIPYESELPPSPSEYANMVIEVTRDLNCTLIFEPGRLIAGNAGILVSQIIYVKETGERTFVIVDAAMNDLIRPSLYDAYHDIVPLKEAIGQSLTPVDVVGPVCESGDIFAEQRALPPLKAGDAIAFRSAGAYGAVMSGTYNSRLLVPEVLVSGSQFSVIRPRTSYEDLINRDQLPAWL